MCVCVVDSSALVAPRREATDAAASRNPSEVYNRWTMFSFELHFLRRCCCCVCRRRRSRSDLDNARWYYDCRIPASPTLTIRLDPKSKTDQTRPIRWMNTSRGTGEGAPRSRTTRNTTNESDHLQADQPRNRSPRCTVFAVYVAQWSLLFVEPSQNLIFFMVAFAFVRCSTEDPLRW
jgi:hypothetical protein